MFMITVSNKIQIFWEYYKTKECVVSTVNFDTNRVKLSKCIFYM